MKKLILLGFLMLLMTISSVMAFGDSWKEVAFTNNSHTLEPFILDVDEICEGECQADYEDIRVYDNTTASLIDYEFLNSTYEHTKGTAQTPEYIQFIVPDTSNQILLYYNNATATGVDTKIFNYTYVFNNDLQGLNGTGASLNCSVYVDDGQGTCSRYAQAGTNVNYPISSDAYIGGFFYDDDTSDSGEMYIFRYGGDYLHFIGMSSTSGHPQDYTFLQNGGWLNLGVARSTGWQTFKLNLTWGVRTDVSLNGVLRASTTVNPNTYINSMILGSSGAGNGIYMDGYRTANQDFNLYYPPATACIPDWYCSGWGSCEVTDTAPCVSATDNNSCGLAYSGDYSEFGTQACDYCTPDWYCSDIQNECPADKTKECYAVTDTNDCFTQTGLPSDDFNGSVTDYNRACGYVAGYTTANLRDQTVDIGANAGIEVIALMGVIVLAGVGGVIAMRLRKLGKI